MTVAAKHPARAPTRLRHRRSARRLSNGQLAELRQAVSKAQRIGDDRGYQYWAGVHGLPLPTYCQHGTQLFLPWHRAYLYFFEKALQDQVPGVTLPWWDWRDHSEPLPAAYARARTPGNKANPLHSSPIQPSGRRQANEKRTWREPGDPSWLPSGDEVTQVRRNRDYFTFQSQLESLHNGVHGFVGGTMASVATSAYDCMVPEDRDPSDLRLPHHLEPEPEVVTVTDAVRRLAKGGKRKAPVDVLACGPDGAPVKALAFDRLRLLTYR